jgi:hypothetical protein
MIEIKELAGAMNYDDSPEVIGKTFHRSARNLEFYGVPGNMRPQSVKGTTLIPNIYLPNTGVNLTIGLHYDSNQQRLFLFNYNSAGRHGIYIYYTLTVAFVRLIETGVNTQGDPLAFTPIRIDGVDIIYGDNNSGDLLFFVDSLKRPRKLNINRILAGTYSPIKDDYLKVIKAPPIRPPECVYENDTTVTANNCLNSLFKFCYTLIYDDFEESVFGSGCAMALPSDPFDPANNVSQTRNCRIRLYLQTGDQNVKKIRIYAKQTKDGVTSDWFVVETIIKADMGISDNGVYQYLFYNNGNYVAADITLASLLQDDVPQFANCQALLNGTTISYGGITEGYDYLNPTLFLTATNAASPIYTINGTLLCAYFNGIFTGSQPQVTIFLTGVGINDGFGNPTDLEKAPSLLFVRAKSNGLAISFNYNNGAGNRNIATLLFNLRGAATSAGWVYVSNTTNSLTIYYPTGGIFLDAAGTTGESADISLYKSPRLAFYPESNYQFGKVYYDKDGRTNGVISDVTGKVKMPTYNYIQDQIPEITIDLSASRPPPWAVYYHIVRTDTLTYNKHTYWVTNQTFQNVGSNSATQFAYFGITNIFDYNTTIQSTEGVVKYGFAAGDRIRVLGRYAVDGTFTQLNLDYSILGLQTSIVVNGITQIGNFVQIYYPTSDINANFKFDGTDDFQNYEILLYSYKSYSPTNQNVFFEIGQEYGIGFAGSGLAYHMGNAGDNLVKLTDGDIFYRQRVVPTGNTYYIDTLGFTQNTSYSTLNTSDFTAVNNSIYEITAGFNIAATIAGGITQFPMWQPAPNKGQIWNKSGSPLSVRYRGTIPVTDAVDPNGTFGMYLKIEDSAYNVVSLPILISPKNGLGVGVQNNYTFDLTVAIPPNCQAWILNYAVNEMVIGGFQLRIDIIKNTTIQIFEPSFSDTYNVVTNSDTRPDIVDTTARQTYFSTLFRFSLPYQPATFINNTNRFTPNNFDEFTKEYGDIIRMVAWQKRLRIFQYRRCGEVGVYAKFIKDNSGVNQLVTSDTIITSNNIQYFEGNFGIANQQSSLIVSGFQCYFPDPIRGAILRLSLDGLKNISEEFKMQTFAGNNLRPYLTSHAYQFGGNANILGTYNFKKDKEGEVIFVMQGGGSGPNAIPGESIAFNEKNNSFPGFYDINADAICCAENLLLSCHNGNLYSHDNTIAYANFYGVQYQPIIELIFNDNVAVKKTFEAFSYQGNQFMEAFNIGDILTSQPNPQTGLPQISNLIAQDYEIKEGLYYAAFMRDANSNINPLVGLNSGDYLKGTWIRILLTYRGSNFGWIYLPSVKWNQSPKNF